MPARPEHAAVMAALHAAAFDAAECWPARAFRELLQSPPVFGFLAGDGGGFALFRAAADEAEVLTIAVLPDRRRTGIASALLEAGLAASRRRGADAIFLEVAADNAAAHALYARAGFDRVGARAAYYADGGDALVLRRVLDPGSA